MASGSRRKLLRSLMSSNFERFLSEGGLVAGVAMETVLLVEGIECFGSQLSIPIVYGLVLSHPSIPGKSIGILENLAKPNPITIVCGPPDGEVILNSWEGFRADKGRFFTKVWI